MNHTTTLRCPSTAAAFLESEAARQARPLVQIVGAAARALESLPERKREALTIGEPMPNAARQAVGLSPLPTNRRNGRKAGAK